MKQKITLFIGMNLVVFLAGCSVQNLFVTDPGSIFVFSYKKKIDENVILCNPENQGCLVKETPREKMFGLTREQSSQKESFLCYPLLEDCQKNPSGFPIGNVEITLWEYHGENEPAGPIMRKTVATEEGWYTFDPLEGTYWATVFDPNTKRNIDTRYSKAFPNSTFHLIEKVEIVKDQKLIKTFSLPAP